MCLIIEECIEGALLHQLNALKYKCGQKAKLCYMITYIFTAQIKAEDIHVNIGKDAETKFGPSNQELDRP